MRRAVLWTGLTFCFGLFLFWKGHIDLMPTRAAKLIFIGAFFVSVAMAIRLGKTHGFFLLLFLAALGMVSLPLLLLA
jgi:hypothetical protein